MDAIEEQAWQAPMFHKSSVLYLYCIDPDYVSELTVPSLPFLTLKCLFGHVSFPGFLSERRLVVFPECERVIEKVRNIPSPCVIEVLSSVEFQIHPDEVDEDEEVLLIWDFNVGKVNVSLTASQCSVKASVPCSVSSIASMPYLDPRSVNCNCSNYQGMILLSSCSEAATATASQLQNLSLCDEENGSEDDEHEDEEEQEEQAEDLDDDFSETVPIEDSDIGKLFGPDNTATGDEFYTETFTLKGSSYHEHFQTALKLCKLKMIKKEPVPIQLSFEPVNRRDENAILVHVCHEGAWKPVGYVPGVKIAKVTQAIKNTEITKMAISSIRYQYIVPIASFKYFASVTVTKKGKWIKNRDSYKYNEDI